MQLFLLHILQQKQSKKGSSLKPELWSWMLIFLFLLFVYPMMQQWSSSPAMDLPQRKQEAISVNLSLTKQKIAGSRRQVTGTIKTINQYSFTKLMVMVGMSIIVLVRRRKAGWRGPTLFHLLDMESFYGIEEDPTLSITIGAMEPNCDQTWPSHWAENQLRRFQRSRVVTKSRTWFGKDIMCTSNQMDFICTLIGVGDYWAVGSELGGFGKLRGKV